MALSVSQHEALPLRETLLGGAMLLLASRHTLGLCGRDSQLSQFAGQEEQRGQAGAGEEIGRRPRVRWSMQCSVISRSGGTTLAATSLPSGEANARPGPPKYRRA